MTIDDLNKYNWLEKEIEVLKSEIYQLSFPVKSLNTSSIGSRGNTVSNPTEQSAFKIIQEKERLVRMQQSLQEQKDNIEKWLSTVDDGRIRTCIRLKYFVKKDDDKPYTWAEVTKKAYGDYYSASTAQKAVERYLKK